MFKLEPNPTFDATVSIPLPSGDSAPLRVVYRHKRKSEIQPFIEGVGGRADLDVLSDLIAGWHDVDADYSPAALAALLDNYPGAGLALLNGWLTALVGAREKN